MGSGPLSLGGGAFLMLYLAVLGVAWLASGWLTGKLRPHGRPGRAASEDELAALAGGPVRLAESAVARLLSAGKLVQHKHGRFIAADAAGGNTPVERAILHIPQPAAWKAILGAASDQSTTITRRLEASGLVLGAGQVLQLRLVAIVPLLLAFAFGAVRVAIGTSGGKPVGFLAVLLVATAGLAIWRFVRTARLTCEGELLLERERERCERIRRAPTGDEMGLSVALFGTAVLAGSSIAQFHDMRRRA
ncbi:MAG: TIGR04222 domain-containing membrane protein, partial [Novosphingobium sp.]|uniref:TIGR04222 domain-containing membrane protein n=1 Tax=Novosphingobium sp. TaxID=1874826 RepID=UPI0032BD9B00